MFLAPHLAQPIYALGIAVFVGGLLQAAIQIPALKKIGMLPRLSWNPFSGLKDAGVRRILQRMGLAFFAVSATQISLMINTTIGSYLPAGSISSLRYADRLMEFPTALLGVALGSILLPSLSKASLDPDQTEYSALLDWGLRLTFLLALPAAVALMVLSVPLTATLFHHGKFGAHAVTMTAHSLVAYGVGLIGIILVKILAPAFYAKQDIRTPVKIAFLVLFVVQALNAVFVPWLAVSGLALSIGLGACVNAGCLFWGLQQRKLFHALPGWPIFFGKLGVALCLMAGAAFLSAGKIDWLATPSWQRIVALGAVILLCLITYFGALLAMGFRVKDFRRIAN